MTVLTSRKTYNENACKLSTAIKILHKNIFTKKNKDQISAFIHAHAKFTENWHG